MTTPAEALLALSPLDSGTPSEHLLAIELGAGSGLGFQAPLEGSLSVLALSGEVGAGAVLEGSVGDRPGLTGEVGPVTLTGSLTDSSLSGKTGC